MGVVGDYCARYRPAILDEIRRVVRQHTNQHAMYQLMLDYPLRPAKGLRPALCIAVARALGATEDSALPTAAVIELLHNAFLIHDDIEDGSHYRRGGPTLQQQHGMPVAVNVADGMLALAIPPLLENSELLGLGRALTVLEQVARMVIVTVEGQATELSWTRANTWEFSGGDYRKAYEAMVVGKTAHYSFIAPVEIGCVIAGADERSRGQLASYAKHLGIAFQITDDLLNLNAAGVSEVPGGGYGKEREGDLWEGKRTLMLLHALHEGRDSQAAAEMIAILQKPRESAAAASLQQVAAAIETQYARGAFDPPVYEALRDALVGPRASAKSAAEVQRLHAFVKAQGGAEYAASVAAEHSAQASAALSACRDSLAPGAARDFLHALIDYVVERLR